MAELASPGPKSRDPKSPDAKIAGAKIKGAVMRALLDWYQKTHGPAAYERIFTQLTDAERAELGERADRKAELLASGWYDVGLAHRLAEIVYSPLAPADRARLAREGARHGLRALSKGVYQFVAQQIVTPAFYARHIQRLFRLLHDTGERSIEVGEGEALSITSKWAGHHPLLCLQVNETTAAVFETLGCREVTVEPLSCVSDGARDCRCRLRWQS